MSSKEIEENDPDTLQAMDEADKTWLLKWKKAVPRSYDKNAVICGESCRECKIQCNNPYVMKLNGAKI